jgi:DNA-binding NarL/FixJ family response regulator
VTARCVVADHHPAIVAFLCDHLTSQGFAVVATAGNGAEALAQIEREQPDFAVVDLHMPGLDGISLARRAAEKAPDTFVVAYTGVGDTTSLSDALDAGVRGFVQKDSPLRDLKRAIETVLTGGIYIDPVVAAGLVMDASRVLTARERDVLRLLAEGHANEEIGRRLFIAPATVRTHLGKAMTKLGATTRTEAVALAIRQKLLT